MSTQALSDRRAGIDAVLTTLSIGIPLDQDLIPRTVHRFHREEGLDELAGHEPADQISHRSELALNAQGDDVDDGHGCNDQAQNPHQNPPKSAIFRGILLLGRRHIRLPSGVSAARFGSDLLCISSISGSGDRVSVQFSKPSILGFLLGECPIEPLFVPPPLLDLFQVGRVLLADRGIEEFDLERHLLALLPHPPGHPPHDRQDFLLEVHVEFGFPDRDHREVGRRHEKSGRLHDQFRPRRSRADVRIR